MPLYETALVRRTISPAVRTNGTVNGAAVDLGAHGMESAIVVFVTGTITDGTHTGAIEEADTATGSWAAVPAARLTGAAPAIGAADDDNEFEVGVRLSKQFLRANIVTSGATTGGATAAVVILGEPSQAPVR